MTCDEQRVNALIIYVNGDLIDAEPAIFTSAAELFAAQEAEEQARREQAFRDRLEHLVFRHKRRTIGRRLLLRAT